MWGMARILNHAVLMNRVGVAPAPTKCEVLTRDHWQADAGILLEPVRRIVPPGDPPEWPVKDGAKYLGVMFGAERGKLVTLLQQWVGEGLAQPLERITTELREGKGAPTTALCLARRVICRYSYAARAMGLLEGDGVWVAADMAMDKFIEELVPRVPELRPNTSQGLGPVPANLREELRWRHRAGMGLSRFALEAGQQAAQAWSYADAVSNFGLQVNRLEALYQVQRRVETPRSRGRPAKVTYEYHPLVHDQTTGEPVLGQGEEVVPIRMRTHEERARERMLETVTGEG